MVRLGSRDLSLLPILVYITKISYSFCQLIFYTNSDIYLEHSTPLTSNPQLQLCDIYRGNSTLTLFELIYPWISYRRLLPAPPARNYREPKSTWNQGLSRLFSFNPWHQYYRLNVARYDRLNVLAIFTSKGIYPQPFSYLSRLREYIQEIIILIY